MRRLALRACAAVGVGMSIGCADPVQAPGPSLLSVDTPPPAQAEPGAVLPPFTVRLADASGTPRPGQRLIIEGDGAIVTSDSVTDASGQIEIQWTLPRAAEAGDFSIPLGLIGDHQLRVRTVDGRVDEAFSVRTDVFRASQFDAAFSYACGINDDGLWCWGDILPFTSTPFSPRPTPVALPTGVTAAEVRVNERAICIRATSDGKPWCTATRLGDPEGFRAVPDAPRLIEIIDAGAPRFCGRTAEGSAVCWEIGGHDSNGAIAPAQVMGEHTFVALAGQSNGSSRGFGCGLDTAGDVWCWGSGSGGRFGDARPDSDIPVQVDLPEPMASIRAGGLGGCGYTAAGVGWCWGGYFDFGVFLDVAPRAITSAGAFGLEVIPGSLEMYRLTSSSGGGIEATFRGQVFDPFPELGTYFRAVEIIDEGQACARGTADEIYCSWIILGGGGDTSPLTATLRPVPAP